MELGIERIRRALKLARDCAEARRHPTAAEINRHRLGRERESLPEHEWANARIWFVALLRSKGATFGVEAFRQLGLSELFFAYRFPDGDQTDLVTRMELLVLNDSSGARDLLQHSLLTVGKLPPRVPDELVWAAFFHDVGKVFLRDDGRAKRLSERVWLYPHHAGEGARHMRPLAARFGFRRESVRLIGWLIAHHQATFEFEKCGRPLFKEIMEVHETWFWLLMQLHLADNEGRESPKGSPQTNRWARARRAYNGYRLRLEAAKEENEAGETHKESVA